MDEKVIGSGLTFDDVLLVPLKSEVLPSEDDTLTRLSRNVNLNIPIIGAAMDTVTDARLAIALAREGGIGIVHKNMAVDQQAMQVDMVKRSESGMISNPFTLGPRASVAEALAPYRPLEMLEDPATLDGGDVVRVGDLLLIGVSGRTNAEAIRQFGTIARRHGYQTRPVPVEGAALHLKSACTHVGGGLVLVNSAGTDLDALHHRDFANRRVDIEAIDDLPQVGRHRVVERAREGAGCLRQIALAFGDLAGFEDFDLGGQALEQTGEPLVIG